MSSNRGPVPEKEEEEGEEEEEEERAEEEDEAEEGTPLPPAPAAQYSLIRAWIPPRSLACASAASRPGSELLKVRTAMLAVAASISLAASQHRFPSSYAWKGCV